MTSGLLRGIPASAGVATGYARLLNGGASSSNGRSTGGSAAAARVAPALGVEDALDRVAQELTLVAERLRRDGHANEAEIVSVGALIAEDPVLRREALEGVAAGQAPPDAVVSVTERHAAAMEALRDAVLRERAADIRQVGRRAAALLRGEGAAPETEGPHVIVAEELGPAEVIGLEAGDVVAGVAVRGGANSHAAIVARTLGLPLVLGVDRSVLDLEEGTPLVVNGGEGTVRIRPAKAEEERARQAMEAAGHRRAALAAERDLPCQTLDGHRITLLCNVATEAETLAGLEAGAEGVGLLRTELTFLDAVRWPDQEDHRRVLEPVLRHLAGRHAVVRVLDFGGDKVPPFLTSVLPEVAGPHMRGLPALLRAEDALGAQLRAALEAGRECKLGILLPMITSIREVRMARAILTEAERATGGGGVELGVMVEVPSAALIADRLAQELDFLSIGTNDLTEHVLGVNRRDPRSVPALAAHPSVLALINRVARAGRSRGKPVRVCGESAADPLVVPLLVGLGIEALSVSPAAVDEVRARVRRLSFESCAGAARTAMSADSLEDVWDLVSARCAVELP